MPTCPKAGGPETTPAARRSSRHWVIPRSRARRARLRRAWPRQGPVALVDPHAAQGAAACIPRLLRSFDGAARRLLRSACGRSRHVLSRPCREALERAREIARAHRVHRELRFRALAQGPRAPVAERRARGLLRCVAPARDHAHQQARNISTRSTSPPTSRSCATSRATAARTACICASRRRITGAFMARPIPRSGSACSTNRARVLAEWTEPLPAPGGLVEIDSKTLRARFKLADFSGSLFMHAVHAAGHEIVKYALDTYGEEGRALSCNHDANAWPADYYAGMPAPDEDETLTLFIQNAHPVAHPPTEHRPQHHGRAGHGLRRGGGGALRHLCARCRKAPAPGALSRSDRDFGRPALRPPALRDGAPHERA